MNRKELIGELEGIPYHIIQSHGNILVLEIGDQYLHVEIRFDLDDKHHYMSLVDVRTDDQLCYTPVRKVPEPPKGGMVG